MSAASSRNLLSDLQLDPHERTELVPIGDRALALAQLRSELARRFPGAVLGGAHAHPSPSPSPRIPYPRSPLHEAPFAWVESTLGEGGLAWLAAWTLLRIARDPLHRPALWVDTHGTLTPGDLLDLEGKLVVVRPADPHEAHVAADVALRTGSFSLVALEMHRALHPTPLARLARLARDRGGIDPRSESAASSTATQVVVWGEPPAFVAPPSGAPRTPLADALHALFEGLVLDGTPAAPSGATHDDVREHILRSIQRGRAPHTTDRLRPMDRAADRRPSPSSPDRNGDGQWSDRGRVDDASSVPPPRRSRF